MNREESSLKNIGKDCETGGGQGTGEFHVVEQEDWQRSNKRSRRTRIQV